MDCGKCSRDLFSPKKTAKCVSCNLSFHPSCTRLKSVENYRKLKLNLREQWKCDKCARRGKVEVAEKKDDDNSGNETVDDELTVGGAGTLLLSRKLDTLLEKFGSLSKDVQSIEESMGFFNDKFEDMSEILAGIKTDLEETKQANQSLKMENTKLNREIEYLHHKLNVNEQKSLQCDLTISGIPQTANEDVSDIVRAVAVSLEVPIEKENIVRAFRTKPNRKQGGFVVVQFSSVVIRNKLLFAMKEKKNSVTLRHLNPGFTDLPFYMNERLTPYNSFLLWLTKQHAREYDFKYVWCKDGRVCLRKDEESKQMVSSKELLGKIDVRSKFTDVVFQRFLEDRL
ncbi:hypothetical protein GE061_001802 [Apolygus lucorum]|uniref:FP protein C-terminal domain-containing protein n=1 Tax=Apolygus lucorum TaxID=248454 RepID=A0A8S9WQ96_APOLU|nr:hypothetical protein GE061_007731 [Apolygus lucorum]KAF6203471.1 hypothetical protein GE061_001802 [Apolygus lucorum]